MDLNLPPVLAAEDEETDAFVLGIAFKRAGVVHPLIFVSDGQEVVNYLTIKPSFGDRTRYPMPILLLLDLKMPRLDGFEVLHWLATRPDLQALRVIVLSHSWNDQHVLKARQLGAHDYLVKPFQFSEYVKLIQGVKARWLTAQLGSPHATAPEARR